MLVPSVMKRCVFPYYFDLCTGQTPRGDKKTNLVPISLDTFWNCSPQLKHIFNYNAVTTTPLQCSIISIVLEVHCVMFMTLYTIELHPFLYCFLMTDRRIFVLSSLNDSWICFRLLIFDIKDTLGSSLSIAESSSAFDGC